MKKVRIINVAEDEDVEINIGRKTSVNIGVSGRTNAEIKVNGKPVEKSGDLFDEIFDTHFPWWVELLLLVLTIVIGIVLAK